MCFCVSRHFGFFGMNRVCAVGACLDAHCQIPRGVAAESENMEYFYVRFDDEEEYTFFART